MNNNGYQLKDPFVNKKWRDKSLRLPEEYQGSNYVTLQWDFGDNPKNKASIVKDWQLKLKNINLKGLNIWSYTNQPLFDAACSTHSMESLKIKWSGIKDLSEISKLQNLKHLSIGSSTQIESLAPLASLQNLEWLEVENLKKIQDFSPLLKLKKLKVLAVTGSMWTKAEVNSLEPFIKMKWLDALILDTNKVNDIKPLSQLKQLKFLSTDGRHPYQDFVYLMKAMPETDCPWFEPYIDLSDSGISSCKKCKKDVMVMLTGKGQRTICRECNKEKFLSHVQKFSR